MEKWPLGVFASIDAGLGVRLDVAHELGVHTVHLHSPSRASRSAEKVSEFSQRLAQHDIRVTCVFCGFDGESYADIPTVGRTIGLVPAETRAARLAEAIEIADFARALGVDAVGLHIGVVPHEPSDPQYAGVVDAARSLSDHCAGLGQSVHLETGQEPADVLERFLRDLHRDNVFINFDPANMILYGVGEPLPALERLGPFVRSVHCKDALWSDRPGETWGQEVPLGQGAVDIAAYLATLDRIGYEGPLTIEREIPQEPDRQRTEVGAAIGLLARLKQSMDA